MTRAVRVANEDAATECPNPRKTKYLFSGGNGVCALCGTGLGKRYTRDQCRDHEKGYQHIRNHTLYRNAFAPAREENIAHLRAIHAAKVKYECMKAAKRLAEEHGATDWIGHGDTTS